MAHLILHISTQGLTAYERDGRELHEIGDFQADDAGVEAFAAYLNTAVQIPVYIITDFIEEEFRVESLPHVVGRDRLALHQRHLCRLFRSSEFRYSRVLDRQKEKRRDDNVLFCALANPELMERWLECLLARNMPLAGIHSVALLSETLIKHLGFSKTKVLLLTHNRNGGLRQCYLQAGRIRFSRLLPAQALSPERYAEFISDEISKAKRYLRSLHFLAPEENLDICIVSGGAYLASLESLLKERLSSQYHLSDTALVADELGIKIAAGESFCDRLFVSLLEKARCKNIYAQARHRRHFKTHRLRTGLKISTLALAGGALLWSGVNISDGLIFREQGQQSARLAQQAQARYDAVASRLPDIPVGSEDIAAAVRVAGFIREQRKRPGHLLFKISHGLARYASIQLNEIAWRNDMAVDIEQGPGQEEEAYQDNTMSSSEKGELQAQYQYVIIKGEIAPFDGNYLRAHHSIESFAEVLRNQPQITEVEILSLPLNVSQSATVEGHFGGRQRLEGAKFSVSIKMRRAREKVL